MPAKARRLSIDGENDVIKSNTQGKPSFFFQERVSAVSRVIVVQASSLTETALKLLR
jgi:hypothetical protein